MKKQKNETNIFIKVLKVIVDFFKYVLFGISLPFILLLRLIISPRKIDMAKLREEAIKEKNKIEAEEIKEHEKEEKEEKVEKKPRFKDQGLGHYLNIVLSAIASVPGKIKTKIDNLAIIRNARNKKAFDTMEMLVDYSTDTEGEQQGKRVTWEYIAFNEKGRRVKGYFDAFNKLDVQSFLVGEGLSVYSIRTSKWIQTLHGSLGENKVKIKQKDLIFLLAQLSTYIKSGIPLVDSLNILIRQVERRAYKSILRDVIYDLTVGENFSVALEKRGVAFPKLLINMVKASELTGELPEALDDMVQYYTEAEEARKEMISALTYPTIVFIFTLAVVTFVLMYVVPKFVDIYNTMDASQIPKFTSMVISFSDFLKKNIIWIFMFMILVVLILRYLYKNVQIIRTLFQWIFMHIPVIKNVIIYNEVTMFSKTFSSLLAHNVHITESMDILGRVTNNEYYKMMIVDTIANLARGDKISTAFKDQWAFPIPAYEMIVTGEKTGQLAEMMYKVSTYYQSLHKNTVSRIKALVEPILIIFLTFAVGVILLAVIIPMFNMYQQVQKLG